MVVGCQVFVYKAGLYYWRIKWGARAGFESAKGEEVDSPFPFGVFQFYYPTKGLLTCLNEQVEYSISDNLNLN